jgi:hypothetical protein
MGDSTRYVTMPEEAKPLLEHAPFMVSTPVPDPYCSGLRCNKGQPWVKIAAAQAAGAVPGGTAGRDHLRLSVA